MVQEGVTRKEQSRRGYSGKLENWKMGQFVSLTVNPVLNIKKKECILEEDRGMEEMTLLSTR